jgi:hypothetical protein
MATTTVALKGTSEPSLRKIAALAGFGGVSPPKTPRAAGGFSGRRFCRIYPSGEAWVLEPLSGGWAVAGREDDRRTFPTLTAAIIHAAANGFSYRVLYSSETDAAAARSAQVLTAATLPFAKNFPRGIDRRRRSPNS